MILAGDIGGTKTVLAICEAQGERIRVVRDATFPSNAHPSLEAILDQFVVPGELGQLTAACFGVAGPVVGGDAKITNLPWTIRAASVAERLGGIPVRLLNDLQATALGTLVLPDDKFGVLQAGAPVQTAEGGDRPSIAIVAPGTGLGESLLVATGDRYRALPSEGGHADFAPTSDDEIALLHFLRGKYGPHISYERVLSGAGIGDLYAFARHQSAAPEPAWLTEALGQADRNAVVTKAALAGTDAVCGRALEMFVEILGNEAGNLALRGLATGGVVLGGGIPPKILPALQDGRFLARFRDKGRFTSWMATLPVRVTLEPRAALLGAAHHAATHKDPRA